MKIQKFENSKISKFRLLHDQFRFLFIFRAQKFLKVPLGKVYKKTGSDKLPKSDGNSTSGHFVNINVLRRKISPNMLFYRFYQVVTLASWLLNPIFQICLPWNPNEKCNFEHTIFGTKRRRCLFGIMYSEFKFSTALPKNWPPLAAFHIKLDRSWRSGWYIFRN